MSSISHCFVVLPWLLRHDINRDVNGGEAAQAPSEPGPHHQHFSHVTATHLSGVLVPKKIIFI